MLLCVPCFGMCMLWLGLARLAARLGHVGWPPCAGLRPWAVATCLRDSLSAGGGGKVATS